MATPAYLPYLADFYTPVGIARSIASWAIRTPIDSVLEPSFGGCAFLSAARDRLLQLGATLAETNLSGFDVDTSAFVALSALDLGAPCVRARFRNSDFLASTPTTAEKVSCVIGNPPYVRHHHLQATDVLESARTRLGLSRKADLWCYFVLHALGFLKPGGRLAMILPAAFVFADYAEPVRRALSVTFSSVRVVRFAFQAFSTAGALERGLLVACEGYGRRNVRWSEAIAWQAEDISAVLEADSEGSAFDRSYWRARFPTLGDVANISIGVVTGLNRHFLVSEQTRRDHELPQRALHPAINTQRLLRNLVYGKRDHEVARQAGERVWLVSPASLGSTDSGLAKYFAGVSSAIRTKTIWFRKRKLWFKPELGAAPDAVLTYHSHLGPRLTLLSGGVRVTNTLHRLNFYASARRREARRLVALSVLTTLTQLSAEIEGRPYGGGMLKLEPSDAGRLILPAPASLALKGIDDAFEMAGRALSEGRLDDARRIADTLLLSKSMHRAELPGLEHALNERRRARLKQPADPAKKTKRTARWTT